MYSYISLCVLVLVLIILHTNIEAGKIDLEDEKTDIAVSNSKCNELREKYKPVDRRIRIDDKNHRLLVMWGDRAPHHAEAALLQVGLRYGLGYKDVELAPGPSKFCEVFQKHQIMNNETLVIHVGAETFTSDTNCTEKIDDEIPELKVVGLAQSAPVQLFMRLKADVANDPICLQANTWAFYTNITALKSCGFFNKFFKLNCRSTEICTIPVQDVTNTNASINLKNRANTTNVALSVTSNTRSKLQELFRHSSILFLDFDLWSNDKSVSVVQLPPCQPNTICTVGLDNSFYIKVAHTSLLKQFAPLTLWTMKNMVPNGPQLRRILELESDTESIEEAACNWALHDGTESQRIFERLVAAEEPKLIITRMFCQDEKDEYTITEFIAEETVGGTKLSDIVEFYKKAIDCTDPHAIDSWITGISRGMKWSRLVGVGGMGESTISASVYMHQYETQLALFDVPPNAVQLGPAVTAVTGRVEPLAMAMRHFLKTQGWRRIAVISDGTAVAIDFAKALLVGKEFFSREEQLEIIDDSNIRKVLQKLVNARVFVVNAGVAATSSIVCAAQTMGLAAAQYVWVVREWNSTHECQQRSESKPTDFRVFSVSYSWRGRAGLAEHQNETNLFGARRARLRAALDGVWHDRAWPPRIAPFTDAMLVLAHLAAASIHADKSIRDSLHDSGAARKMVEHLANSGEEVWGLTQRLRAGAAPARPTVFVDEWRPPLARRHRLLGVWVVNESHVEELESQRAYDSAVSDGTPACATALRGEAFEERCLDGVWFSLAAVLALAPLALWGAARARRAARVRREQALALRLLARCERTAAALRPLLLPRDALRLRAQQLGAGHFGRVTSGLLRRPGRFSLAVAVKALRTDASAAEEAEFLREACALAAVQHPHVVRLVGVCADGPPLLLMEHAFFGDLLQYLHERRPLVELAIWGDADGATKEMLTPTEENPEAMHVSAPELTRLAREAASALAFVASRRYVHRDVRAANCLIDANRSLKVADFGLARTTTSENTPLTDCEDPKEDYAYICRRRGVFPVPWMAPESLECGVFSAASDVWALGVLILELATLGARPYGAWRPPRVLRFVRDGGRPPLPRDATYHLCEVTSMCWARDPKRRATAAEVQAYLEDHPAAIRPALRPRSIDMTELQPEDADFILTDSGFGERETEHDFIPIEPHISTL